MGVRYRKSIKLAPGTGLSYTSSVASTKSTGRHRATESNNSSSFDVGRMSRTSSYLLVILGPLMIIAGLLLSLISPIFGIVSVILGAVSVFVGIYYLKKK